MKPNVIVMLSNLALSASFLFIPILAEELGASKAQIGVIGATYGFAVFASSYLFGRASDVYGRRFFIHLGLGVSTLTFFLQVLADPSFVVPFWQILGCSRSPVAWQGSLSECFPRRSSPTSTSQRIL